MFLRNMKVIFCYSFKGFIAFKYRADRRLLNGLRHNRKETHGRNS